MLDNFYCREQEILFNSFSSFAINYMKNNTEFCEEWNPDVSSLFNQIAEVCHEEKQHRKATGTYIIPWEKILSEVAKGESEEHDEMNGNISLFQSLEKSESAQIESREKKTLLNEVENFYCALAMEDSICRFIYHFCKRQEYSKANILIACIRAKAFDRAYYISDLISQTASFQGKSERKGWYWEIEYIVNQLIFTFGSQFNSPLSQFDSSQLYVVSSIINEQLEVLSSKRVQKILDNLEKYGLSDIVLKRS